MFLAFSVCPGWGSGVLQSVCLCVFLSVCLSASISLELLDWFSQNLLCRSPVAMARSSSGGIAIRYALPVLWMTSRLAVVGCMAMCCDTGTKSDVYEYLVCCFDEDGVFLLYVRFQLQWTGSSRDVQSWSCSIPMWNWINATVTRADSQRSFLCQVCVWSGIRYNRLSFPVEN